MAIFKAKMESKFTTVPNSTLQDKRLTLEARGLLGLMLSLPEDWEIYKEWLQKQSPKLGRDKLTRIMSELQEAGYMRKKHVRNDQGQIVDVDWLVYPIPEQLETSHSDTEQLKTRTTANPNDGKSATTKETLNTKETLGINGSSSKSPAYPEEFEWIWSRKPAREGANPKKGAYSSCKARIKQGATWKELAEGLCRYRKYCDATKITGSRMVQQMKTFFGPDEHYKETWAYETTSNSGAGSSVQQAIDSLKADLDGSGSTGSGQANQAFMDPNDRDLRNQMDQGVRGETDITLDRGDWEVRS